MQSTNTLSRPAGGGRGRSRRRGEQRGPGTKHLVRAIAYLGRYKKTTLIAYAALIVSTLAQLAVPQLVQNILDAITNGLSPSRVQRRPPPRSRRPS